MRREYLVDGRERLICAIKGMLHFVANSMFAPCAPAGVPHFLSPSPFPPSSSPPPPSGPGLCFSCLPVCLRSSIHLSSLHSSSPNHKQGTPSIPSASLAHASPSRLQCGCCHERSCGHCFSLRCSCRILPCPTWNTTPHGLSLVPLLLLLFPLHLIAHSSSRCPPPLWPLSQLLSPCWSALPLLLLLMGPRRSLACWPLAGWPHGAAGAVLLSASLCHRRAFTRVLLRVRMHSCPPSACLPCRPSQRCAVPGECSSGDEEGDECLSERGWRPAGKGEGEGGRHGGCCAQTSAGGTAV